MTDHGRIHVVGGAILAGGSASRLGGIAKGLLKTPDGLTVMEKQIRELKGAGIREIVISANDAGPYLHLGPEIVPDISANRGPLAGAEAALAHFGQRAEATLFLPCDMPAITREHLSALEESFFSREAPIVYAETPGFFSQPLCAIVHNGLLSEVSAAIRDGQLSVRDLWNRLGARALPFDNPAHFVNINSQTDLEAWRARCEDKQ